MGTPTTVELSLARLQREKGLLLAAMSAYQQFGAITFNALKNKRPLTDAEMERCGKLTKDACALAEAALDGF